MQIDLPYGDTTRSVTMPSDVRVEQLSPRDASAIDSAGDALVRALEEPVAGSPLRERTGNGARVLIVVSDLTRNAGVLDLLPTLVEYLSSIGVADSRLSILVARGTHAAMSTEERKHFRTGPLGKVGLIEHDCDDASSHSAVVLTRRGTPVRVNRAVRDCDVAILLSGITFHYFAGFGGGRKLILPGCSDRVAIEANHRLSLTQTKPVQLHPGCMPGNLSGNRVHDDMCEVAAALPHLFAVNCITDTTGRIVFVNSGDPILSHEQACETYRMHNAVAVEEPASVIVVSAGGMPYDVNLLQAHKALCHAGEAAVKGADILFFAECAQGIGSSSLERAINMPEDEFLDSARDEYYLNNQTGVSLRRLTREFRVGMVSALDGTALRNAGIEPCENIESFIATALDRHGAERVAVIRFGSQTLPVPARSHP